MQTISRFVGLCSILAVLGCTESHLTGDGGSPPTDGGSDGGRLACSIACGPRSLVDVAVVVQDQTAAAEYTTRTLRALARPLAALAAVADLRVGVVHSDVGVGDVEVPRCTRLGDDGALMPGTAASPECEDSRYLDVAGTDVDALGLYLTCRLRADDCGFEQPLESMLLALTPSTSRTEFFTGAGGRGDTTNAGFLRNGSLLVVVMVTQDNDCSAADRGLFDPMSADFPGSLDLRCFDHPSALHPARRYVDGLLALRAPEDLALFLFGGVPVDIEDADVDAILADERMIERIDPIVPTRVAPSCVGMRRNMYAPRRQLEVLAGLGDRGVRVGIGSMCGMTFDAELSRLLGTVDRAACGHCAGH